MYMCDIFWCWIVVEYKVIVVFEYDMVVGKCVDV